MINGFPVLYILKELSKSDPEAASKYVHRNSVGVVKTDC